MMNVGAAAGVAMAVVASIASKNAVAAPHLAVVVVLTVVIMKPVKMAVISVVKEAVQLLAVTAAVTWAVWLVV
jgi:hypothetical protein